MEGAERHRSAGILREYLAERDAACETCGYNLRGVTEVQCPECGVVIPRPPAERLERIRVGEAALKLWCRKCGAVVNGVDVERCPECGRRAVERFSGERPPRLGRMPWAPRTLPIGIAGMVPIAVLAAIGEVTTTMQSRRQDWGRAAIGVSLCAVPLVIAALWHWRRRRLAALPPAQRLAIAVGAFAVGVAAVAAAVKMMP